MIIRTDVSILQFSYIWDDYYKLLQTAANCANTTPIRLETTLQSQCGHSFRDKTFKSKMICN